MTTTFGVHDQLSCGPGQSPVRRFREAIDVAVHAEHLGYDSFWPVEQHFDAAASAMPAPLMLLAAVAERTSRLRLGTGVVLLPLHHPLRVAEEAATLDVLSRGRVELGVGRGMDPAHFAGFDVESGDSAGRLDEGVRVLRLALRGQEFDHSGRFHRVPRLTLAPAPVQRPHLPIRVAANSVETLRWAGRLGLPVLVALHVNPIPRLVGMLEAYRAARSAAGHLLEPDDITVLAPMFTAPTADDVRRLVTPGLTWLDTMARNRLRTWRAAAPAGPAGDEARRRLDELAAGFTGSTVASMHDRAVLDTPDGCADRLRDMRDTLGVHRFICWFDLGGVTGQRAVRDAMELFAAQVMPAVAPPAHLSELSMRRSSV